MEQESLGGGSAGTDADNIDNEADANMKDLIDAEVPSANAADTLVSPERRPGTGLFGSKSAKSRAQIATLSAGPTPPASPNASASGSSATADAPVPPHASSGQTQQWLMQAPGSADLIIVPSQQQQQQQQQQQRAAVARPPPAQPSPGYTIKRACQPNDRRAPGNAIQRCYVTERDQLGLIEYRLKSYRDNPRIGACALCEPDSWTFYGSQYDPYLSLLYAERDGCIPSSVVVPYPKFVVPWRYKNKRTGEITWKIFHLSGDKITSADSETIIVNPAKDIKLRNAMRRVAAERPKYNLDPTLVEFLLKVVRETLGDYGLPGGPTSGDADARLYQQMLKQGHNLMLLCEVEIGLCRHKALLFKILCDICDLNCALVTGYSTAGRHQWNIITLPDRGDYLIDPTSPHFTWTTKGSHRTKGYRVSADQSFGHSGFTQKENGII